MIRRLRALLAIALLSIAAHAKEAAPEATPPAPEPVEDRVTVEKLPAVTSARATVAGELLALAAATRKGGGRDLLLLVAPPEPKKKVGEAPAAPAARCDEPARADEGASTTPRRLVRFDPGGAGSLTTLRDDLPPDTHDLVAADLDGDGTDELLIVRSSGVGVLHEDGERPFAGAPALLFETPNQEIGALLPGAIHDGTGEPDLVSIATLGSLCTYGTDADGAFGLRSEIDLPLVARREAHGLDLSSPQVQKLEGGSGVDVVVVEPEPRGPERLRCLALRPGAGVADRAQEAWLKLPAAERVLETSFLLLDGRPAVAVTTVPAGKLSFFGEKLLRVFYLESDRTRAGKSPVAALGTNANLWQAVHVVPADVNGDGKQDLVVGYWKGLKDDTVVLDAYLRREDGTFERSPRSTSFDVESADRGFLRYGDDLDGRGLADLVLVGGGNLALYPGGDAGSGGRKLVQTKPAWTLPLPGAVHDARLMSITIGSDDAQIREVDHPTLAPLVLDLDGDGRKELVVAGGSGVPGHVLVVLPPR